MIFTYFLKEKYHIQSHIFNICNFETIPELQTIHLEKRLCLTRFYVGRNCKFDVVLSPSYRKIVNTNKKLYYLTSDESQFEFYI